jgi:hypothetical protein
LGFSLQAVKIHALGDCGKRGEQKCASPHGAIIS